MNRPPTPGVSRASGTRLENAIATARRIPWWCWLSTIVASLTLERQLAWAFAKKVLPDFVRGGTIWAVAFVATSFWLLDVLLTKVQQRRGWNRAGWRDCFAGVTLYGAFSWVRNSLGSAAIEAETAFGHGETIVRIERTLGLFFEQPLQQFWLNLPARGGMFLFGIYYATAHFAVTVGVLVHLGRKHRQRFSHMATWMGTSATIALAGFWQYPLMPPRLLSEIDPTYKIVDALAQTGGSVHNADTIAVSNQYAAMPSLHCAWAMWCLIACWRFPKARGWMFAHLSITVLTVLITGHHYWLDAVGGAVTLGVGWVASKAIRATWAALAKTKPAATTAT